MDIPFYISELLFSNDCVIIPGFGGFVAHYSPAKIHPVTHNFQPPSKNILFNSKLIRDDGLLIDFISEKQNMAYGEVKSMVEEFTRITINKLASGEVVRFRNIGNLQKDPIGKLLFSPDHSVNYLEEAFGLSTFVSPPVIRKPLQKRAENHFVDRKPVAEGARTRRRKYIAYAAIAPVVLLLGWFVFFGNFKPDKAQQSGIITLPDSEQNASLESTPASGTKKIINPPLESLDLSNLDAGITDPEIIKPAPAKAELIIRKKYYIIGGAFGVEQNADKLVDALMRKGYEAERAGISPSGLHMVSYFSTPDKNEALVNLDIIRKEENSSAWLIRK